MENGRGKNTVNCSEKREQKKVWLQKLGEAGGLRD